MKILFKTSMTAFSPGSLLLLGHLPNKTIVHKPILCNFGNDTAKKDTLEYTNYIDN